MLRPLMRYGKDGLNRVGNFICRHREEFLLLCGSGLTVGVEFVPDIPDAACGDERDCGDARRHGSEEPAAETLPFAHEIHRAHAAASEFAYDLIGAEHPARLKELCILLHGVNLIKPRAAVQVGMV